MNALPGYRKKPIWIHALAVGLMLAPFASVMYPLARRRVAPDLWVTWAGHVPAATWVLCGLLFVAGLSMFFVRRWTWQFTLAILTAVVIFDFVRYRQVGPQASASILGMVAVTAAVVIFLCTETFRRPYLNPRLRWWETSVRFKTDLPVSINDHAAVLVDISRTGVLVERKGNESLPDDVVEPTLTLPGDLKVTCKVARRTETGYGLQFINLTPEQTKSIKQLLKQLETDPTRLAR